MRINLVIVSLIIVILHFAPVCLRIQVNKENKEFKVKILFLSSVVLSWNLWLPIRVTLTSHNILKFAFFYSSCYILTIWQIDIVLDSYILNMTKQSKKEMNKYICMLSVYWLFQLIYFYGIWLSILMQDLAPERAFADFVLCNLVLHLVIMNFLG